MSGRDVLTTTAVLGVRHEEGRAAFVGALDHFLGAVEPLDDRALLAATRCWGWTVVDLVTHVRLGLEEVACCLLTAGTCDEAPGRDAATCWRTPPPGTGSDEIARLVGARLGVPDFVARLPALQRGRGR